MSGPTFSGRLLLAVVLIGASAVLRAADPEPLRIHVLSGSKEYKSETSLKGFIADLEERYHVLCSASWGTDKGTSLDNLESLKKADLMVVFCRRLKLPEEQMAIIRSHYEGGKPVIGIRTASHPFQEQDNAHFDRVVLGNHYDGHYVNEKFEVTPAAAGKEHPVLAGVQPFQSHRLYKAKELAPSAVVLQTGDIGKGAHPLTIVNTYKDGRMFYTSLGMPEDFEVPAFRQLLRNAVFWTTRTSEREFAKTAGAPSGR